jgi:hypothetical protein
MKAMKVMKVMKAMKADKAKAKVQPAAGAKGTPAVVWKTVGVNDVAAAPPKKKAAIEDAATDARADTTNRQIKKLGILKYQATNGKDPEKQELAKQALGSYNAIMGRNASAIAERAQFLQEFEANTNHGKDKNKLKWFVDYKKKVVGSDTTMIGSVEHYFTRLAGLMFCFLFHMTPPEDVKVAPSVGGRLII